MGWIGGTAAGLAAIGLALGASALLLNGPGLFAPPGPASRLGIYLSRNFAETADAAPFPELRTPQIVAPPSLVRELVVDAMRTLGWEEIGVEDLEVRAVAVTPLLRFRDAVQVSLEPAPGGGTRLHVRSSSRVGRADFGANRRHVLDLLAGVQRGLSNQRRRAAREGAPASPGRSP